MKKLIYILAFLLVGVTAYSQSNIVKGSGIIYTNGVPNPAVNIDYYSEVAIDTTNGQWYEYLRDSSKWSSAGFRNQIKSTCGKPTWTPQDKQSYFIVDNCDSLFRYKSGTWTCINIGGGGGGGAVSSVFGRTGAVTAQSGDYTASQVGALSNATNSTQDGYFGNINLFDDSSPSHYTTITNSGNNTATRTLSINNNDADRTLSLSGNLTVSSTATISGTNTGDQTITLSGDVSGSGTSGISTTIANTAVTFAKFQNIVDNRLLGRSAGSNGSMQEITIGSNLILSGGTLSFNGVGVTDGDKGGIDVTSSGTVWTVDTNEITTIKILNASVTNAKLADVATATFKGRTSAGTGSPEDLTVAQAKTLLNLTGTNSGDQTITLTGDVTGSGTGSFAATLATVNSNVGTFGSASNVGTFTVNGKGLITSASNTAIQITESQVTNLVTDLLNKNTAIVIKDEGTAVVSSVVNIDFTGAGVTASGSSGNINISIPGGGITDSDKGDVDVTSSGSVWTVDTNSITSIKILDGEVTTSKLATVNSNVGSFGTASNVGSFTVNNKGQITAASNTAIQITESQVTNLTTDLLNKNTAITIKDEGTAVISSVVNIDFVGAGVTATGSSGNITITIPSAAVTDGDKGDIDVSGTGTVFSLDTNSVMTIDVLDNNITYAKIQDVTATNRFLGRITAGSGDIEELTANNAVTILNTATTALSGTVAPFLSNSTSSSQWGYFDNIAFLDDNSPSHYTFVTMNGNNTASNTLSFNMNNANRDLSFSGNLTVSANATISGTNTGDQTITLTSDVTGSGTGSFATTISADAVTFAKMQNISTNKILGRGTAGTGDIEEITLGTNLSLSGTTLNATGGSITDGDKGDIDVTSSGSVWSLDTNSVMTIDVQANAITNAKLAQVATATFKGRTTAGTGDVEDLTVSQAKALLNLTGTNSGDQTITLTGDITGSGTGSFATTLATVNSNVGSFGTASKTSTFTVNGKGLITAASEQNIQITESQVTNLTTDLLNKNTSITIKDEGTPVISSVVNIDFTGAGVTASGSSGNITINVPGSGGGDLINGGNTTGATVYVGTNDNNPTVIEANNVAVMKVWPGNYVHIGSTNPIELSNSGIIYANDFYVQNFSNKKFSVITDVTAAGTAISLSGGDTGTGSSGVYNQLGGRSFTNTSGTKVDWKFDAGFNPSSGTGVFYNTSIEPIIAQVGGSNGITGGLRIKPSLINGFTDFRAIQIDNDTSGSWGIYQSGKFTKNLFGGVTRFDSLMQVREFAAPGTPASGYGYIYEKTDNKLYFKNDAGTEYDLTATGGGGGGLTDGDYGDIVVSGTGTVMSIDNNVVTNADIRQSAALSVIGNSTNATANVADITAGTDGHILRRSGTSLGFGLLVDANVTTNTLTFSKLQQVGSNTIVCNPTNATANISTISLGASTLFGRGSTGDLSGITVGSGLTLSGTTLSASGGGGGVSDGDKGDIDITSSGTVYTIDTASVSFLKIQNIPTNNLIGRTTAGTGEADTINVSKGLKMASNKLYSDIAYSRNVYEYMNDFLQNPTTTTTTGRDLMAVSSGTGSGVSSNSSSSNEFGVIVCNTGTTLSGRSSVVTNNAVGVNNVVLFGGGEYTYEAKILPFNASDASNRYQTLIGFFDTPTAVNQVDGVYFLYDEGGVSTGSTASANWQIVTCNASTRTFTTTSTAVDNTNYTILKIIVNAAGTRADFYVNGTNVGNITTNIPKVAPNQTGFGIYEQKSIGVTARTLYCDYIYVRADINR